jgi:hypothetical protein
MVRCRQIPGRTRRAFADDVSDATPVPPSEKPLKKQASKASKKKDKPPSKVQRPQTVEKKLSTPDSTEPAKQGAEPQSVPSQPAPSQLRSRWPDAPPPGTFSR